MTSAPTQVLPDARKPAGRLPAPGPAPAVDHARFAPLTAEALQVVPAPALGPAQLLAVQRSAGNRATTQLVQRSARPLVQRFALDLPDWATEDIAEAAAQVPGFTLLTVIVGTNPITGRRVPPTPDNLLAGLLGLVPFGDAIYDQLVELGIVQRAFDHLRTQLATFDLSLERLGRVIEAIWDEVEITNSLSTNIAIAQRHIGALVADVEGFAESIVGAVVDFVREAAVDAAESLIGDSPLWALAKKVLHNDPLRGVEVEAPTVEILADFLRLIGKEAELGQLEANGVLKKAADWIDTQLAVFSGLLAGLSALFSAAWEAIQPANIANLGASLGALAGQALELLGGLSAFAQTVAAKALELVKDAVLVPLDEFCQDINGFHLLTVVIGRNPFTGVAVPPTAENLIRGFLSLLPDGEATYQRLAETGRIEALRARISAAMESLGISWEMVVGLFRGIWDSLSMADLIDPEGAFQRLADQFGGPIERLVRFVSVVVQEMLRLLLEAMKFPSDVLERIITNALAAIDDIQADPLGFLENMLAAVQAGFQKFFDNVGTHLLGGLTGWLFRTLEEAGIDPPTEITLESVLDLVLQVLGISEDQLWEKLGQAIGPERVERLRANIDRLTGILSFIGDVRERGVPAIWEYVSSQLSNLWDLVLGKIQDWITEQVIDRVVARLISMLDPFGIMAVINGFMAFFDAVQSAIEYAREMLDIVDGYVSTIAAVAKGDVEPGAVRLEEGMAASIPVAIGFLANQVGLGDLSEKLGELFQGVHATVDEALDWLMEQVVSMGTSMLNAFGMGPEAEDQPAGAQQAAEEEAAAEDEAAGVEAASVDPADHVAFARHAAERLKTAERDPELAPFEALQAVALALQPRLSRQLEAGIGLRYEFPGGEADAEDGEVRVRVVVAPNDTTLDEEVDLAFQEWEGEQEEFPENAGEVVESPSRRTAVSQPEVLREYLVLSNERIQEIGSRLHEDADGYLARTFASTPNRRELQELKEEFDELRSEVGSELDMTEEQSAAARRILHRARTLAADDWNYVRGRIRNALREDDEHQERGKRLEELERQLVRAGDAKLSDDGSLCIRTLTGEVVTFEPLNIEHTVRRVDNPWRYDLVRNLELMDAPTNQVTLEAIRRGGVFPDTDEIERFVVERGLNVRGEGSFPEDYKQRAVERYLERRPACASARAAADQVLAEIEESAIGRRPQRATLLGWVDALGGVDAGARAPRGFPDAYKQRSVELYRELREGAASDAAAIRAVLDELEEPVGRDNKPHPSTIRRWVAGDLTAEDPE